MEILRVYNNNVAAVLQNGDEMIVSGRGICF